MGKRSKAKYELQEMTDGIVVPFALEEQEVPEVEIVEELIEEPVVTTEKSAPTVKTIRLNNMKQNLRIYGSYVELDPYTEISVTVIELEKNEELQNKIARGYLTVID